MKCPLLHGNIQKETDRETVPKFRTYRSVFLFHQNFTVMGPKFRIFDFTYRSMILFHQNFTLTIPKFRVFKKETYFHFEKESTCDQNQLPILISKGQPRPTVTTGNFVFLHQNFTEMGPKFRTFEKKN